MYHMHCCITFLLFSARSVIGVEEESLTEDKILKDIHQKVMDLWSNLLPEPSLWTDMDGTAYAACELRPNVKLEVDELTVTGHVLFKQIYPNGKLEAIFDLEGFPTGDNQTGRAIHIHKFGDLSDGCDSTAGHYNPFNVHHPRHPGDFGNFATRNGKIRKRKANLQATLFGPYSILGRAIVVHKQEDDLGKGNNKASLENGNAGKRLACCVIGTSNKNMWEKIRPTLLEGKRERISPWHMRAV